jgi:glycosyltransferase involved in cell wall biosynthesis
MKAAFFPNTAQWDQNPYLSLLVRSVEEQGVSVLRPNRDFLSTRWLWAERDRVDLLHFHWIQYHYLSAPGVGSASALLHFLRKLVWARLLGYRIVWTLHNILPHERIPGKLDWFARWSMCQLAHAVLVLCEAGRKELARRYGRRKGVYTTPHGNFVNIYGPRLSRAQARARLGWDPGQFVYLYFGGIRPHKNVEKLMETFASLPGERLSLLVAGAAHGNEIRQRVERLARQDARIRIEPSFISEDQLRVYLAASDVVALPFIRVLSSSSVITAMSYGRPVIAPALGCLREWVTEDCGILYAPDATLGLREALVVALDADLETMGQRALARASTYTWDMVGRETVRAYWGDSFDRQQ